MADVGVEALADGTSLGVMVPRGGVVRVVARNRWVAHRAIAAPAMTVPALRRALAGAGLRVVDVFALFGSADEPRALVPLEPRGPLAFYYRTRVVPGLPLASRLALRGALRLGLGRHLVPGFVAVAVRPGGSEPSTDGFIAEHLRREWRRLMPEIPLPRRLLLARMPTRTGGRSTVSVLLFVDDEPAPVALLKINRDPGYRASVEAEFTRLSAIRPRLRACRSAVPRPLFLERVGGHVVFAETVVPGGPFPMGAFLRPEPVRQRLVAPLVDHAFDWLEDFHAETATGTWAIDAGFVRQRGRAVFDKILARFPESRPWREALLGVAEGLAKFQGALLPRGVVHGDFTHANLLFDGSRLGVVDWEDCTQDGLPLDDVFFFVCQLALNYHGEEPQAGSSFRRFLLGDGPLRRRVLARLQGYAARFGFDPRLFGLLLPSFLADLLVKQYPEHRAPATYGFATLDGLRASVELAGRLA
jgi:aminoglycoside phosphotransferase (APT) family kinase protein